jgi:hypothetical protein
VFAFRIWSRLTILAVVIACAGEASAAPALTTIQDVLYKADGTRFNGTVFITWSNFQTGDDTTIPAQGITLQVYNGVLKVQLAPTTTASAGANYTVRYASQGVYQFTETWAVPPSATPLRVRDVRVGAGSVIGVPPPPVSTQIEISDVAGLSDELNARATRGPGYAGGRAAIINSSGQIDAAAGRLGDCVRVDGTSGPCGSGSSATPVTFVDSETPAGAADGVNLTFTLANAPSPQSSLALYRNGLFMTPGVDYTLNGAVVTFVAGATPQPGDIITASYRYGGEEPAAVAFVDSETPSGAIDGANRSYTLTASPSPAASLALYRNGVLMTQDVDYTLSGATIDFIAGVTPQPGDILTASYRYISPESALAGLGSPQVVCSGAGQSTSSTTLTSLGTCTLPANFLQPGDRVEVRFNYTHQGAAAAFTTQVKWGQSIMMSRTAPADETAIAGRADAGVNSGGAQWNAESWGSSLSLAATTGSAPDSYTSPLTVSFLGQMTSATSDSVTLRNFTVIRYPAQSNP